MEKRKPGFRVAMLGMALLLSGCVVAPPPPPVGYVSPPPIVGNIWIGGFWNWSAPQHRYYWTPGYWTAPRTGYRWVPHQWVQEGPHWRQHPGHWERGDPALAATIRRDGPRSGPQAPRPALPNSPRKVSCKSAGITTTFALSAWPSFSREAMYFSPSRNIIGVISLPMAAVTRRMASAEASASITWALASRLADSRRASASRMADCLAPSARVTTALRSRSAAACISMARCMDSEGLMS